MIELNIILQSLVTSPLDKLSDKGVLGAFLVLVILVLGFIGKILLNDKDSHYKELNQNYDVIKDELKEKDKTFIEYLMKATNQHHTIIEENSRAFGEFSNIMKEMLDILKVLNEKYK